MFKDIVNVLKEEYRKATKDDEILPLRFNDPIALEINWQPIKKGGSNFRTHKFVRVDQAVLKVLPTLGLKIFIHFFLIAGASALAFFVYLLFEKTQPVEEPFFVLLVFGLIFSVISVVMNKTIGVSGTFDKISGFYWRGKKGPREVPNAHADKRFTAFSNIYALQIIRERVRSDESTYSSYELNLIRKDKSRVNVTDHSNIKRLREDAKLLSEFLGVPVWDSSLQ